MPPGWIETGISVTHSGSVTVQVIAASDTTAIEPLRVGDLLIDSVWIGVEPVGAVTLCGDGWYSGATVNLYTRKEGEAFGARVTEDTIPGSCPQQYLSLLVTRVITGLRLAANVDVTSATGATRTRYRLWADGGTVDTLTVGSKVVNISHIGVFMSAPDITVRHEAVGFVGYAPPVLKGGAVLTSPTWNLEADPTSFDVFEFHGYQIGIGAGGTVWTYITTPPLHYHLDVDVRDAAGALPAGNVQAGGALVANPGQADVTAWRWSEIAGAVPVRAVLAGDWSSGGVSLVAGEEIVPLRDLFPKSPDLAPEEWAPTTYEISASLAVLLSVNTFAGSGGVATGGAGGRTWTVTGAGAATRTLAATYDPSDGYLTTKHVAGEDVWGWGLYAYLDVDLTAPANGNVTLTLTWVAAGAVPVSAVKTYTLPVVSGTHTYRVDLLFPNEGGPWYAERVSTVAFSALQNGTYTLNSLILVAVEDSYLKLHARGDESGLVIAQDGSFAIGHWGDNPVIGGGPAREKDDESGLFSFGGPSDTSEGGCVRMNGTLQAVALEWDRMEGMTVSYDPTLIDASLTDGTNVIGTVDEAAAVPLAYSARWYETRMGWRTSPGFSDVLPASIYCDGGADICAVPAGTLVLPFRHTIGMVLESQVKDAVTGKRAGPGIPIFARRSLVGAPGPSDPLLGTASTDASGFVSVAIRTGTVGFADFYAGLVDS